MKITRIDVEPILGKVRPEVAIISSLGEHLRGHYMLVRIGAGDLEGLGEASVTTIWSGESQAGAMALVKEEFEPLLLGADPFDVAWIDRRMNRAVHGNSFAKAAVEMALYDLQGKFLQRPVHQLLGGKEDATPSLRLKFVIGAVDAQLAAERARRMVDAGWTAIKVKVGRQGDPAPDVERLTAVREAIGPETWLSVDANGGYTVKQAIQAARTFQRLNVALFEQPTRRGDHRGMARVCQATDLPVMADESVFTMADAVELIRHQSCDVFSLYPGKHGGMRATQAIAAVAESAGIPCAIGSNLEREIATAGMAHVAASTPNIQCESYPGDLIGPLYYEQSLTREPLRYEADRLFLPWEPGLGCGPVAPR